MQREQNLTYAVALRHSVSPRHSQFVRRSLKFCPQSGKVAQGRMLQSRQIVICRRSARCWRHYLWTEAVYLQRLLHCCLEHCCWLRLCCEPLMQSDRRYPRLRLTSLHCPVKHIMVALGICATATTTTTTTTPDQQRSFNYQCCYHHYSQTADIHI